KKQSLLFGLELVFFKAANTLLGLGLRARNKLVNKKSA
ncbi:MAG: hypothetical protein ACI89S_002295, partial [Gammaproteobacteria bacterium]